jgi:ergothioneine biosynthesis protein EgtB
MTSNPPIPATRQEPALRCSEPAPTDRAALCRRLLAVRERSLALAAPLSAEDQCVQSMPDASPAKWHLAHTTWFFEAMVLGPLAPGYRPVDPRYAMLFNSYYEALGPRHPRPQRGLLTRPSVVEVGAYRAAVDAALARFVEQADDDTWAAAAPLLLLGMNHEQQHQELLLTDVLHLLSLNPLRPAYAPVPGPAPSTSLGYAPVPAPGFASAPEAGAEGWLERPAGLVDIGHAGGGGFAFDNETPRHRVWLQSHALARRLVSNGEFAAFIADGGYRRPALWLSEGWAAVQASSWQAPLYWTLDGDTPVSQFTLHGEQAWRAEDAVRHISFFEAAAYAEWAGPRLPTEFEWEAAATGVEAPLLRQLQDTAWQWTRSSYDPYPGFRAPAGAVGEYNGKFMVGQIVLRGGSIATPGGHSRPSYRNFFPPAARWQFSGLRLAADR